MPNWFWFLVPFGVLAVASLIWWDRIAPYLSTRPKGREASGADAKYRDELRAMRDIPVAPELISDGEMDLAWGLIWHDFEAAMQKEIDRVFAPYLAALPVDVHSFPAVVALVDGADKLPTGEYRLVSVG